VGGTPVTTNKNYYGGNIPFIRSAEIDKSSTELFLTEEGKAGEFYTPQQISTILSSIVTLDSQNPTLGKKKHLDSVLDFACGSGSLLLNVRHQLGPHGIGKIYGQEKNITTYNLARRFAGTPRINL